MLQCLRHRIVNNFNRTTQQTNKDNCRRSKFRCLTHQMCLYFRQWSDAKGHAIYSSAGIFTSGSSNSVIRSLCQLRIHSISAVLFGHVITGVDRSTRRKLLEQIGCRSIRKSSTPSKETARSMRYQIEKQQSVGQNPSLRDFGSL